MEIGSGRLLRMSLNHGEEVILESNADVEEVSSYMSTLNPLNLYRFGAVFYLGRLFLTTERLILLPYSQAEVRKAKHFEKIAYMLVEKVGLNVPSPEIRFFPWPVIVSLWDVRAVNPFRKQLGVHPSLYLYTLPEKYLFKFSPQDNPCEWAELIADVADAVTKDIVLHECVHCGMIAGVEGANTCASCKSPQAPSASDILSGKWATDIIDQIASVKGWKQKLRALTMPSGHTLECHRCHFLNHKMAKRCKYCGLDL